jgi:hypothetical protein
MELKVENLKNYVGLPVCYKKAVVSIFSKPTEEWCIISKVSYEKDMVRVDFTDERKMDLERNEEHTMLFVSV